MFLHIPKYSSYFITKLILDSLPCISSLVAAEELLGWYMSYDGICLDVD